MSMIENHHSLNLAYDGKHYARVDFPPHLDEADAQNRSMTISAALKAVYGSPDKWSFRLSKIECVGREVEFEKPKKG